MILHVEPCFRSFIPRPRIRISVPINKGMRSGSNSASKGISKAKNMMKKDDTKQPLYNKLEDPLGRSKSADDVMKSHKRKPEMRESVSKKVRTY